MGLDDVQPFMDFADPVGISGGLCFCQQGGAFGVRCQHGIERTGLSGRRFLGNIAHACVLGHVDAAVIGFEHAGDDLHQCRLARTIAADHPDARTGGQRGGRAIKDHCAAETHGYITEIKHGEPLAEPVR